MISGIKNPLQVGTCLIMKTRVFFAISVLCYTIVAGQSDWTGNIKAFLDSVNLTANVIETMTKDLYENVTISSLCEGIAVVPMNESDLLSSPEPCDPNMYNVLKAGVADPKLFNGTTFLTGFWRSTYGDSLLNEFENKGFNTTLLKDALQETWFSVPNVTNGSATTPFNKIFLGYPTTSERRNFKNWYTHYSRIENESTNTFHYHYIEKDLPQVVLGFNETDVAYFIYPSHPHVDLILYTLCAWRSDSHNDCLVTVPGNRKFYVKDKTENNTHDGSQYLNTAIVELKSLLELLTRR